MSDKMVIDLAPRAKSVWIITLLFLAGTGLFLVIGFASLSRPTVAAPFIVTGLLCVALIILMLLYAPLKYVLTDTELVVSRIGPKVRIGLSQIESVEHITDPTLFKGNVRAMGVGGAFGFYGLFFCPALGAYRAYVVRRDRLVLIRRRGDDPVVLSPREPADFVEQVRARLPGNQQQVIGSR